MRQIHVTLSALAAASAGCLILAIAAPDDVRPAATPTAPPLRQVRLLGFGSAAPLPEDLLRPEGKSRWDLTRIGAGRTFTRSFSELPDGVAVLDDPAASEAAGQPARSPGARAVYKDDAIPGDGAATDAARRWAFPDRYPESLRPGARESLDLLEEGDRGVSRLRAEIETVGIGWLHLPSGPREVSLQRVLLLRSASGGGGWVAERLVHRFVDPRAGVVAEIGRRPGPGPLAPGSVLDATVLDQLLAGAATLKIYVEELDTPVFSGINYGYDRGANTPVSSLTPQAYANLGALLAADTWDFSGMTSGVAENSSTGTPVTPAETCNSAQCGFNANGAFPNRILGREDKVPTGGGTLSKTNATTEREVRAGDITVWLRGGTQFEGSTASGANGESRFCYASDDGVTRSQVPIWRFAHQDALGWFMQPGDPAWVGGPFNCEQNLFHTVCGVGSLVPKLWIKACSGTSGAHTGTQSAQILKGGVVTLPSGHTFNALLAQNLADFCVYAASGCSSLFKVDEVRTFVFLWQVPVIGTVARLTTIQNPTDANSQTSVAETDFKFGLFPPLSMTVTGTTDTSVSLSWDPGRDTHRITGYKVYWGTASGSTTPYPFDSSRNPGQASIAGTTATISGLTAGTSYFLSVTSLSAYTDPSTLVTTTYESILYPTQVSGDPAFVYPIEVQGRTTGGTCVPAAEATGLTVDYATGGGVRICWQPVSDPCLVGYEVLGADSPQLATNFSVLADTDLSTCWTGNPSQGYYLVAARGTGGTGPWGAYGR